MATTISRYYRVKPQEKVKLSLSVGHGQKGVSSLTLEATTLRTGHEGDVEMDLGIGDELDGKTLYITTSVSDVQPGTDQTSVSYDLSGGHQDFHQALEETAPKPGAVVHYSASFFFYL